MRINYYKNSFAFKPLLAYEKENLYFIYIHMKKSWQIYFITLYIFHRIGFFLKINSVNLSTVNLKGFLVIEMSLKGREEFINSI